MAVLGASLSLITAIVVLCEVARRATFRLLPKRGWSIYALEFISTFQLCACTHELKLLAEVGGLEPEVALTLTYVITVVHGLTFHGAICNPTGALEQLFRGTLTSRRALVRIACQLCAAALAQRVMPRAWAVELSPLHAQHALTGFKCTKSPINASALHAAAVELSCALVMHSALSNVGKVEEKYQVYAIATVITSLVYAGGHLTGAVFNPALAFSLQFPCPGNSFWEYTFIYWLGPVLGMMGSLLLFDRFSLSVSGKSKMPNHLISNGLKKKKRK